MKLTLEQKVDRRNKINMTAACRCGKQVTSVEQLMDLVAQKRSVWLRNGGLLPAIVVANMATSQVYLRIKSGGMFEYIPLPKFKKSNEPSPSVGATE